MKALTLTVAAAAISLAACGSSAGHSAPSSPHAASRARAQVPVLGRVTAAPVGTLPTAVQDAAVAPLPGGGLVLLGGIDSTGSSTDAITVVDPSGVTQHGTLPIPQHDAQAATLGRDVYVFGGGQVSSYDHILRYDPAHGAVAQAGSLSTPASDVAVVALGGTAYVVGGFTGVDPLDTIVAWTPSAQPRVAARLPAGLRYAAAAVAGKRVVIAGGTLSGGVSDAILGFDPASGAVTHLGRLPFPVTHASAAFVDGRVVVVGGRRAVSGDQTDAILAIDPSNGAVRSAGRLPQPLSDAAVAADGNRIIVAGGETAAGPQSSILALTPHLETTGGAR